MVLKSDVRLVASNIPDLDGRIHTASSENAWVFRAKTNRHYESSMSVEFIDLCELSLVIVFPKNDAIVIRATNDRLCSSIGIKTSDVVGMFLIMINLLSSPLASPWCCSYRL
jgi:hypothetical protein